jgi:hypothetical protein
MEDTMPLDGRHDTYGSGSEERHLQNIPDLHGE